MSNDLCETDRPKAARLHKFFTNCKYAHSSVYPTVEEASQEAKRFWTEGNEEIGDPDYFLLEEEGGSFVKGVIFLGHIFFQREPIKDVLMYYLGTMTVCNTGLEVLGLDVASSFLTIEDARKQAILDSSEKGQTVYICYLSGEIIEYVTVREESK